MKPQDFMALAEDLLKNQGKFAPDLAEAIYRTALSRLYHGVLHWIQERYRISVPTSKSSVYHAYVVEELEKIADDEVLIEFAIKTQSLTIPVIANTISYIMTITPDEHTRQSWIIHCLEDLNSTIISLPDSNFRDPANNRKNALSNKILNIIDLIQNKEYEEAYDEMLHDVKPKLTGLKIDEQGNQWGNGVFNEPWVIVSSVQNTLAERCDAILLYLLTLSRIPDHMGKENYG